MHAHVQYISYSDAHHEDRFPGADLAPSPPSAGASGEELSVVCTPSPKFRFPAATVVYSTVQCMTNCVAKLLASVL